MQQAATLLPRHSLNRNRSQTRTIRRNKTPAFFPFRELNRLTSKAISFNENCLPCAWRWMRPQSHPAYMLGNNALVGMTDLAIVGVDQSRTHAAGLPLSK
jgi:hypothetical protein